MLFMNNNEEKSTEKETSGTGIGFTILMYFITGAVAVIIPVAIENHNKEKERQERLDDSFKDVRQAVREGKGSEGFNILFKEEYEAYLKEEEAREQTDQDKKRKS